MRAHLQFASLLATQGRYCRDTHMWSDARESWARTKADEGGGEGGRGWTARAPKRKPKGVQAWAA